MRSATQEAKDLDSVGWRDYSKMKKQNCNVAKAKAWKAVGKPNKFFKKQTKIWVCKDGKKLRICDMSDFHLINAIKMLQRFAKTLQQESLDAAFSLSVTLQGEMATYYIEQDIDRLLADPSGDDFLPNIYGNLEEERQRRNLPVA